jgi:hypothetical protein
MMSLIKSGGEFDFNFKIESIYNHYYNKYID